MKKNHKPPNPDDQQLDMFSTPLDPQNPIPHPNDHLVISDEEVDSRDIWALDSIFLHDVPIAADEHVKKIPVQVVGADGVRRQELRDGKTLYRRGPHPTHVLVDGKITTRESVRHLPDDRVKPVMVDMITTVLYDRGVVQHDHVDIMHCLLGRMNKNLHHTGRASGTVLFNKMDIANDLDIGYNGHHSKSVEDALDTLSGMRIIKSYQAPNLGDKHYGLIPEVTMRMGGVIINSKIEKLSGLSQSGRRPDVITVELNPGFVRSMSGDLDERPYLLRSFNLTKNLKHSVHWKRHLHRVIESRIDTSDRFYMPLEELWVDILGCSMEDLNPEKPEKWRKTRWKVLKTIREWKATGYLDIAKYVMNARVMPSNTDSHYTITTKEEEITVPTKKPVWVQNKSNLTEYVLCTPGPQFRLGRPMTKKTLAHALLKATLEDPAQIQQMIDQLGIEFIVETAYQKMKSFIQLLGDRSNRLSAQDWLTSGYPMPNRVDVITTLLRERKRQQENDRHGRGPDMRIIAPHYDRRLRVMYALAPKTDHFNYDKIVYRRDLPTDQVGVEIATCVQLALDGLLQDENISRHELLDEDRRLGDAGVLRKYLSVMKETRSLADRAAFHMLWGDMMFTRCQKKLPTFGETYSEASKIAMSRRYPEAWNITVEMNRLEKKPWERHLGMIFRRRLAEQWVEAEKLDEREPESPPPA